MESGVGCSKNSVICNPDIPYYILNLSVCKFCTADCWFTELDLQNVDVLHYIMSVSFLDTDTKFSCPADEFATSRRFLLVFVFF